MKGKVRFATENGSVYEVDQESRIWTRIIETREPGSIRTISGAYEHMTGVIVGVPVRFYGEPLSGIKGEVRILATSPVKTIETLS